MFLTKLGTGRRCITASAGTILGFLEVEKQELGTHGLDLLCDFGTHIKSTDYRTQAGGGTDRGKTGYPGSHDQHFGRRHLARSGDLAGKEATEVVTRFNHCTIAGDIGHRGEGIHLLRPGDTRHHVHGDHARSLGTALLQHGLVLRRPEETDQGLAFTQLLGLRLIRLAHLDHYFGFAPQHFGTFHHADTSVAVRRIIKTSRCARSGLDQAFVS